MKECDSPEEEDDTSCGGDDDVSFSFSEDDSLLAA